MLIVFSLYPYLIFQFQHGIQNLGAISITSLILENIFPRFVEPVAIIFVIYSISISVCLFLLHKLLQPSH